MRRRDEQRGFSMRGSSRPPAILKDFVMRGAYSVPLLGLLLLGASCAQYRAKPLDSTATLRELDALRLDHLVLKPAKQQAISTNVFDYSDGLSADEASAVAVQLSPVLIAARAERGVAEGQLVAAGLLPNPELDASAQFGDKTVLGANLLFDLTDALVARGPRRERARLRLEEVNWDVAAREWAVANDVRRAWFDVAYADVAIDLNHQQQILADETLAYTTARRDQGVVSELDLVVTETEAADTRRQGLRLAGERRLALQRLNLLLGLPPSHETRLEAVSDLTAYSPFVDSDVDPDLAARRPDLRAAAAEYGQTERDLQLAYRLRFPRLRLGPSFARDEGANSVGLGVGIELPLFNRNQGGILEKTSQRDRSEAAYRAKLHQARAEVAAARTEAVALDEELSSYFKEVAPRLDRELTLIEATFKVGELDVFRALLVRSRLINARKDLIERLRASARARIAVIEAQGPNVTP